MSNDTARPRGGSPDARNAQAVPNQRGQGAGTPAGPSHAGRPVNPGQAAPGQAAPDAAGQAGPGQGAAAGQGTAGQGAAGQGLGQLAPPPQVPNAQTPGGQGLAGPDQQGGVPGPDADTVPSQRREGVAQVVGKFGDRGTPGEQAELYRAQAEFNVAGTSIGDNIGRDKHTTVYQSFQGQGASTFRAYRLTPEDLAQPFVPGAGLAQLAAAVRSQRIVLVRGKVGAGKVSALLHTYGELPPDGALIVRLAPDTDLTVLSPEKLPENAALILPDLTASDAARLDGFTIDHLSSELEKRRSRLGITVGTDVTVTASVKLAVVELGDRPNPRAVFDKHLATLLTSSAPARAALLADPEVRQLLDDRLVDDTTLEQAARLAAVLADQKDDPAAAAAAVRALTDRRDVEDCDRWFRDLPGLRAHCMAISLAVLNGLARELVSGAADDLEELIAPKPDPGTAQAPPANPFVTGSETSLSVLCAKTAPGTTSISTGDLPVTTMSYENRNYPRWVLRHAWQEHDTARPAIVKWLERLGRHENRSVRIRTATAVGMLAVESFTFVCPQIIVRWAWDEQAGTRDSAALALGPPASDPRLSAPVTELVERWSHDDGSPLLQATAARVQGGGGGLTRPSVSLRKLAALAEVDNADVAVAVAKSLGEMVTEGTNALAGRVVAEVGKWIATGDRQVRLAGRVAFLWLTYLRGTPRAVAAETGNKQYSMPTLLVLARHNPALVGPLSALWSNCLNSSDSYPWIHESLDGWAESVEPDLAARAHFVDLLRRSAIDPRTNRILVRQAGRWSGDGGAAPKTSEALLAPVTGVTTHV